MFVFNSKEFVCPFNCFSEIIRGKWRAGILLSLSECPKRFSELQKENNGISSKVLADNLHMLENANIITRTVFATIPPSVEYSFTENGRKLSAIMDNINSLMKNMLESDETELSTK